MTPEDMAVKLEAVDQRSRSNAHRLDDVEKRQDNLDKLVTSVEVLATKQETVESDVKEIKSDVKALAEKPGKRWEGLVDKLLFAVAGAVLAWLAAGAPGL
jgi:seryl-tRNA synthetase